MRILIASDLSDDASSSAQQISCGSDLNLQKVVPNRERQCISHVWVHCGCGDLSFLGGLADNTAMDLGLCTSRYGCQHIKRQGYIIVEEMVRSDGFLEIKVKLNPERRRMADLTTDRR